MAAEGQVDMAETTGRWIGDGQIFKGTDKLVRAKYDLTITQNGTTFVTLHPRGELNGHLGIMGTVTLPPGNSLESGETYTLVLANDKEFDFFTLDRPTGLLLRYQITASSHFRNKSEPAN